MYLFRKVLSDLVDQVPATKITMHA